MDETGLLSPVEEGWLRYARDVVGDLDHRRECALLGGSPDHPGVDAPDLRWPGYLGERAAPGRSILCVGAVHREFASGSLRAHHRDRLVDATRAWAGGRLDDQGYLAASRSVYLAGLHGWPVGTHLRQVADALGLDVFDLVFTNAARCQVPELPPELPRASATKVALQDLCLGRFPITPLVRLVRPRLLLFISSHAYDVSVASGDVADVPRVCMHQRNGLLVRSSTMSGAVAAEAQTSPVVQPDRTVATP